MQNAKVMYENALNFDKGLVYDCLFGCMFRSPLTNITITTIFVVIAIIVMMHAGLVYVWAVSGCAL